MTELLFFKVPENLVGEIFHNFNKLLRDLQKQESTEAMAYLKIMGAELGYIKGNDLKFIIEKAILNAKTLMYHAKVLFYATVLNIFFHSFNFTKNHNLRALKWFVLLFSIPLIG